MGRLILIGIISLMVTSYSFADDYNENEAYELLQAGKILPLEDILKISRKKIQGRVLEVELEHEDNQIIYELEILDKQGIVWEIKINAMTGIIIEKEKD